MPQKGGHLFSWKIKWIGREAWQLRSLDRHVHKKNGGNKDVETAIALDEINSELKEINVNKYVDVSNTDDEKYIFKIGNWAVKITSEGKFKTDCNVNNS